MPELKVVDRSNAAMPDQVFFGAYVTVADVDDTSSCLRIVGSDETDAKKNWISIDSVMARALLKRRVDDEVVVHAPKGTKTYYVVDIRY